MSRLGAYVAERFPVRIFGPVVALLAGATLWAADSGAPGTASTTILLVSLLLVQFRLWDDLEDADRDRRTHPHRVLVNGPRAPFRMLLLAVAAATAAVCLRSDAAVVALLGLDAGFLAAYRWLRPGLSDSAWRYGVLLLKYPAFVLITSLAAGSPIPMRLAVGATAAYVCASSYERWHHQLGASV
jgi:hypothetical protein